jgi:mRNA interferase YafQ
MHRIVPSKKFQKSLRKIKRSGKFKPSVEASFNEAVNSLAEGTPLPTSYSDHQLTGEWSGYRECHIKGDLLLIYQIKDDVLVLLLADIGSHSQLFE